MSPRLFASVVAGVLLVVGLILLGNSVNATTSGGATVACGTGFKTNTSQASHDSNVQDLSAALMADSGYGLYASSNRYANYAEACSSALTVRRGFGWGLAGLGALTLLGAVLVRPSGSNGSTSPSTATPAEPA